MVSLGQVRHAVSWAGHELGIKKSLRTKIRVLPWSATAHLNGGGYQYWVKVSPPHNSTVESKILTVARERGLSAMPTLVSTCDDLNAVLLEHVPSHLDTIRPAEILESKNRVCAALTEEVERLGLTELTVGGCTDVILSNCRQNRSSWIGDATTTALANTIEQYSNELAALDTSLSGASSVVHGDFHSGNVIGSPDGPVLIDWADAAYGLPIWDEAAFEASSGRLTNIDHRCDSARFSVLAGLKEITDFLLIPPPIPGQRYTVSIPYVRIYISRRAAMLIRSLNRLRHHDD